MIWAFFAGYLLGAATPFAAILYLIRRWRLF
jgi:hypothetical protein